MAQCGLSGRCGFFDRSDLETVRGILRYEQHREQAARLISMTCNAQPLGNLYSMSEACGYAAGEAVNYRKAAGDVEGGGMRVPHD